ncbi:MAG TPA: phosphotransferase [Thermoanaerobaculia bacterium]|jgi:thiamine kinase-like enzyme|nr:phosphotransferase [Thermoanaerobaculia bacterium]
MFVDPANVVFYLAERRLLTLESVVRGDFMVVDQSSRNRNLKVIRKQSPGYFLKQAQSRSPEYTRTLEREAACYQLLGRQTSFSRLASLLPSCHHYDAANFILVLQLLPNAESLWEHHLAVRRFPVEIARLQGSTLGSCHRQTTVAAASPGELAVFERKLPWILSIHETNPMYLNQMSLGNAQLLQILQLYPELPAALEQIKRSWVFEAIIHGDVKWENLVLFREREEEAPELRVIDWEMADVGDACWDAGAIFQAYLSFWIFSLPLTAGVTLEAAAASSPLAVEEMQPALAAYWTSYAEARGLRPAESGALLERSIACAAARMIQTAYEGIQRTPQITPQALCQLQMSMNILRDPRTAIRDFLGSEAGVPA